MTQDFSGQNLRGRNFKDQDLTGANFSHADIRGANFNNAILIGANFSKATAGMQRRWVFGLVTFSLVLSPIIGLFSAVAGILVAVLFTSANIKAYTIIPGTLVLIILAVFFIVTIRQGLEAAVVAGTAAVAGAVAAAVAGTAVVAGSVGGSVMGTAVAAGSVGGSVIGTAVAAGAVAAAVAGTAAVAGAVAAAVIGTVIGPVAAAAAVAGAWAVAKTAVARAVAGAVAVVLLGFYLAWRALTGDEKYAFVRKIALSFASRGGTSFCNADLTDADFTQATLKCTKFIRANLTRKNLAEWRKYKVM